MKTFKRSFYLVLCVFLLVPGAILVAPAQAKTMAAVPPMGWNDWAHYQCHYTAKTVLDNAKALVSTGLVKAGYDTVTIDDCWMARHRDASGNLQANRKRFPQGIAPVVAAVHAMGLKFGIYEDAGSQTCGGFAGSGVSQKGGNAHFRQDLKLFAKWGVDYLKLDGCNVHVPHGKSALSAYREAYAAASKAIGESGRKIVFLESAPAYFQGQPEWYDVLAWVGQYGQLWREGSDIQTFSRKHPDTPRFRSVLWNYVYNLPLGRYQKPGNWNDPDFIIGGDHGMSLAETRSQVALWSMMSAPLVLSVNVDKLSPEAIRVLGNKDVIAVDQDALGRMATLVQRTPARDVLLKPLSDGDFAVAVLNHSYGPIKVNLPMSRLGFVHEPATCRFSVRNLWTHETAGGQRRLAIEIKPGDTAIWRVHPGASCKGAARAGTIVMVFPGSRNIESYGRCLADSGVVRPCRGTASESWTVSADGMLHAGNKCLAVVGGKPSMESCKNQATQRWTYRQNGNLVNASDNLCLSAPATHSRWVHWAMKQCGHNQADQIWALPN